MSGWNGTDGVFTDNLRAVSRTHGLFKGLFGPQFKGLFKGSFLCISFIFYGFIKALIETIRIQFYFQVLLIYNHYYCTYYARCTDL